jgi:peptidoglycan hydrolase CwlO-like protein
MADKSFTEAGILATIITAITSLLVLIIKEVWKLFNNNKEESGKLNREYREDLQTQIKTLRSDLDSLIDKLEKERKERYTSEKELTSKISDFKALIRRLLTVCETHDIDVSDATKEYNKIDD